MAPFPDIAGTIALSPSIVGTITPQPAGKGPALLVDTPLLVVLAAMKGDIAVMKRVDPSSGSLKALTTYAKALELALAEARDADAYVDTEEAARHLGVGVSAITKRCREDRIKAKKSGGIWMVHKSALTEAA
jgi:hypothetical protein